MTPDERDAINAELIERGVKAPMRPPEEIDKLMRILVRCTCGWTGPIAALPVTAVTPMGILTACPSCLAPHSAAWWGQHVIPGRFEGPLPMLWIGEPK